MSAQHTPLPWVVNDYGLPAASNGDRIFAAWEEIDVTYGDAAYIVRACNAFPHLVVALRDAEQQIVYLHEKFRETGSGNTVIAHINAVLAKACAA